MSVHGSRAENNGSGAHWRPLLSSGVATVSCVKCRPPHLGCSHDLGSPANQIAFVKRGAFRKHRGRRVVVADAFSAVLFRAGEEFRSSHPHPYGDDCVFVRLPDDIFNEVLPHARTREVEAHAGLFALAPAQRLNAAAAFAALARGGIDPLAAEETILALVGSLNPALLPVQAHARAIGRAREVLAAHACRPWGLGEIARAARVSPFHLSRSFKRHMGLSLSAYRTRLRLAAAVERLCDGEDDITQLALATGFSSHSHFSMCFKQVFGLSPSTWRGRVRGKPL